MNFTKFWNNLKYWQRGAMIGFIVSFMFVFLLSLWAYTPFESSEHYIPFWIVFVINAVFYIIPATIIASVSGLIIGKIFKR